MRRTGSLSMDEYLRGRTLIIVSNRGPVSFKRSPGGRLVADRGGGGLTTAMLSVCRNADVRWISAAMTPEDRDFARGISTLDKPLDPPVRMVDIPDDVYDRYYNRISNHLFWFVFHRLWNLTESPSYGEDLMDRWLGYVSANRLLASSTLEEAALCDRPVIMLQDYHLFLAARFIKETAPEIPVIHFNHIPWPDPGCFDVLPFEIRQELIEGLLAADIIGFQTPRYATAFINCCERMPELKIDLASSTIHSGRGKTLVRSYPISIDPPSLIDSALSKTVLEHEVRLRRENAGMKLIVRSDRADLSKNILRGFQSYDRLLLKHPELKGCVRFLAFLYPTREAIPEYTEYRDKIERCVEEINSRHALPAWEPIHLRMEDNYLESLAALKIYDVLLVNPIFDGMNLVAKEGPVINEHNGVLVLSENAGAFVEMGSGALAVSPFDVDGTASALHRALTMPQAERLMRAAWLKEIVEGNSTIKWVHHQLRDLQAVEKRKTGRAYPVLPSS